MIENGDRVLICLSGGKDSLTLLHTLKQLQHNLSKRAGISFSIGAVTGNIYPNNHVSILSCIYKLTTSFCH